MLIKLAPLQRIWVGRHARCLKNTIDAERSISPEGTNETVVVKKELNYQGFGTGRVVGVKSPPKRVTQTGQILFGDQFSSFITDQNLYNFKQFPHWQRLSDNNIDDPRVYAEECRHQLMRFQLNLHRLLIESQTLDSKDIAIISHGVICNFVAMMFTSDAQVQGIDVPGSAGFLISQNECLFIHP